MTKVYRSVASAKAWSPFGAMALAALIACGTQSLATGSGAAPTPDAAAPTATSVADEEAGSLDGAAPLEADASTPYDPFAPQPDESEGLTNVSSNLNAVLENGALAGACDSYYDAGQTDPKTTVLCGKWQFFYETFGVSGMPEALVQFLATNFPDQLGLAFSNLGMIPDPTSTTNMPLGIAPTAPLNGNIPAVAFTCASCHFAQLPDGRYSVGAPHQGYDYARHILTISIAPGLAMGLSQPSAHDPAAVAEVQPVLDAIAASSSLKTQLTLTLLPLASLKQPALTTEIEHDYSTWPTGTLDFLIAPLPIDDHVHIVGKMIGLWGIPRPAEVTATGMSGELLGWTGDTEALDEFLVGFATLGGSATTPTEAQLTPLMEYVYSLRAPSNPTPPDPAAVTTGAALFSSKGCTSCHDGPRGSGKQAYTFAEIGTDPALEDWADPSGDGGACCGITNPPGGLTHGVKSPRLVGMWSLNRLLHDGTLSTLDQLFCRDGGDGGLDGGRPPTGVEPLRTDGHDFTCNGLTDTEKTALIAYLLAH
ncbi:MAG: hypothetical protein ACLQBL_40030 [Polyangiaceae bacterium]|jgi:hypothetical protein